MDCRFFGFLDFWIFGLLEVQAFRNSLEFDRFHRCRLAQVGGMGGFIKTLFGPRLNLKGRSHTFGDFAEKPREISRTDQVIKQAKGLIKPPIPPT